MHTNIRGYDSKVLSLQAVADRADIITVNETLLKNNRAMKLPGFTCYNRNRQNMNGGGIATCIKSKDAIHSLKVFEGLNDEEILITRHGQFLTAINVINIYGSQEGRVAREKIEESFRFILDFAQFSPPPLEVGIMGLWYSKYVSWPRTQRSNPF